MANLPNAGAPAGSPSSADNLENLLARLSITPEGAREIVRALVAYANLDSTQSLTTTTTTSSDSIIAASPTVATGAETSGPTDDNADDDQLSDTSTTSLISLSDLDSVGHLTAASSATLVAASLHNVAPLTTDGLNTAAPAANAAGAQTAVTAGATSVAAAPVVAPTAVNVALPLYGVLPVNAPANAILPPAHLLALPYRYHVPAANAEGPFYVVTRGHNIGVFNGCEKTVARGSENSAIGRADKMREHLNNTHTQTP
ncbi:uncharacterized protein LACBIDRAFT_317652 [Laccaria bicolor S238N-H82]|uniref:Predicted protein n=1 Tax=Laccaria bicolor (strain S238N-H82 / ATCC MYA-4686) TaxID=486041 RepID=B0E248_LACBS|nr:uncharacterized protein LACBIDRAFT_317652 [Laccaria bicolor S238N-H82]EDQ99076.1 predicted protein [Laccaria bicolor S238N-H82]|eukprot:XP_001890278.1 predicted protein [Laccaria bicolor S238N-H82]